MMNLQTKIIGGINMIIGGITIINTTLEQVEKYFGLTKEDYNEEGKPWSIDVAYDFAELTEGDILTVSPTLEGVKQLNNQLESELDLTFKLDIICVDGIYMGIDPEDAEILQGE